MIKNIKSSIIKNFFDHQYIAKKMCDKFRKSKIYKNKFKTIIIRNKLIKRYNIYLGVNSNIGENIKFPHPSSIIIGDKVSIGNNCTIYQNVTIGKKNGNLKEDFGYPIIEDNVTIFAGATIIGNIIIEKGAVIGANSVVLNSIKTNSVVAGIPAKELN